MAFLLNIVLFFGKFVIGNISGSMAITGEEIQY